MLKLVNIIFYIILILTNNLNAKENVMILKLKDGDVKIEMFPDVAPNHVKRITELANQWKI
jgi:Peptidyl-prolyl cis-trans isomerase (rotamase) - cyclophilin family